MERTGTNYLKQWLLSKNRNPLVIRGARQVGKTWLVRHFAKLCGRQLIELNFEKQPSYLSLFTSNDPNIILLQVGALFGKKIDPEKYLLFFLLFKCESANLEYFSFTYLISFAFLLQQISLPYQRSYF